MPHYEEPVLIADAVVRPLAWRMGIFVFILGTALIVAVTVMWVTSPTADATALVGLVPGLIMFTTGGFMVRSQHSARTRRVSYAVTRDSVWRRVGSEHWAPYVALDRLRRLEAGTDNIRYAGAMNAGATLLLVDEDHNTFSVGPVPDPMRWVEVLTALCAETGTGLETYVQPWVPKYNPPQAGDSVT